MRLQKWRVLVAAAALAGCATSHPAHGAIAPPITAFSSSLRPFQYGALCSVSGRLHPDGPVEAVPSGPLRGNPLEVHAVWLPGLNDHQCRSTVATAGAPIAGRLVHDIETSPRQPPGPYSCPSDDGRGVDLVFQYATTPIFSVVTVALSGCGGEGLPGGASRAVSGQLMADLSTLGPPAWFQR